MIGVTSEPNKTIYIIFEISQKNAVHWSINLLLQIQLLDYIVLISFAWTHSDNSISSELVKGNYFFGLVHEHFLNLER
jgi:hypothetical protein